jgi:putative CocE/NonD family hydrolase
MLPADAPLPPSFAFPAPPRARRSGTRRASALLGVALAFAGPAAAADEPAIPPGGDIPASFAVANASFDFERRTAEIPMRDGVKLHTVILVPRQVEPPGGKLPILLTRTPYSADKAASRNDSPHLEAVVPTGDDVVAVSGYVRVFQDVRGKYGSEGDYVMNRPLRGPLNATAVDHATDTWDTIDWLVRNVPESNGRVGMIGTSYPGFLVLMGLFDPHPALAAAVPINPMVDVWMGDDWFHHGAFRQVMLRFVYDQTASKRSEIKWWSGHHDDYVRFLEHGSAAAMAEAMGMEQLPFWRRLRSYPAYGPYWQEQAVDRLLAARLPSDRPLAVPTLHVHGYWDQEDLYGAPAAWAAMEARDPGNDRNFLVMGPWRHSGSNGDGRSLGAISFAGDTARYFRAEILQPFLDQHLKGGRPAAIPPVLAYQTGSDRWQTLERWPLVCPRGCAATPRPLYLHAGFRLGFDQPAGGDDAADAWVSDPAKPVPYRERPIRPLWATGSTWGQWLVDDQRFVSDRPDVLVYVSDELDEPLAIAGQPQVELWASTTGTDADWVVKLIDLYPSEVPAQPELGGYQLGVAMDIFRGRYRESFAEAKPIVPGQALPYRFALPHANHVFRPGHRIMVQIQSTWFPLYDRNPQTFVENIFTARPEDYRAATHRVHRGGATATSLALPIVPLASPER